jgi:hypothetical protein
MSLRGSKKYAEDEGVVLSVTIEQNAGPQPWHEDALFWRNVEGLTVRKCAEACGVSFGRMQRFLNPESKRKAKVRQARMDRERRHADPKAMEQRRTYSRRYAQFKAPGREKKC